MLKSFHPVISALSALGIILAISVWASPPTTTSPALPGQADSDIGSTRNSRVAWPMQAGERTPLVFLTGDMSEADLKEFTAIAPNVRIISGLTRQTALEHALEANGCDIRVFSEELIAKAPNLVWVQALSAGVDRYVKIKPLVDNDRIVLTNMRAVHGPAIADHAMAMLLELTRNLRFYNAAQSKGQWSEGEPPARSIALKGRTMLVVGLGGIGSEIAQRAHGFGMRVIATRRTEAPVPEYVARVGKSDDLLTMLPEADVVAVCVPLTWETENLFDTKAFAAMKPGAYLINIARGKIVNTNAMVEALRSGRLGGACLDVTDPEPLPEDHPLWKMPGVVITPHVAADAEITEERRDALLRENIRRFGAGEPLLNVVDKKAGY